MATGLRGVCPSPPNHRDMDALTAETQGLLLRFYDLSPSELHTLARRLDTLADALEMAAARKECGPSSGCLQ